MNEQEVGYQFSVSLHAKLKEKVRGHVFCRIEDDSLYVKIEHRTVLTTYRKDDMMSAICRGVTTDDIVNEVVGIHRTSLKKVFLINE